MIILMDCKNQVQAEQWWEVRLPTKTLNLEPYWLVSLFLPHTTYFKPELILLSKTHCGFHLIKCSHCSVEVNFHLKPLFQAIYSSRCTNITTTTLRLNCDPPT